MRSDRHVYTGRPYKKEEKEQRYVNIVVCALIRELHDGLDRVGRCRSSEDDAHGASLFIRIYGEHNGLQEKYV